MWSTSVSCLSTGMQSPVSILEPLAVGVDKYDEEPLLEIDPELVRILMQITEQDLTPTTLDNCSMHPLAGSNEDEELACMRLNAEKDFSEWKERRKLERRSSRLSRHDSGSTEAGESRRTLSYRHTLCEAPTVKKNTLCYSNSYPFHS